MELDGRFAVVLGAALVLGALLSIYQHVYSQRVARRLTAEHQGARGSYLVSGRGKGWLRGAVVYLVVDSASSRIEAAEAMVGATVFARFRPRPELLGSVSNARERAGDKRLGDAVESAIAQYRSMRKKR
ncbi:transcriptional regulator GutM [Agrococcus jejuensis]|uniref:Glucitol operon activator protein (GutM) n=1 Tax=Agrococcus jejuensis TaxID=399736 RepID=A0A1G8BAW0_9MICO|nr:transcriptional regulator GutM [Agrococcus jejuensis]SDH30234.1 Glucitol operon activator protein (GutM) [Agrococcus jejuensis]